MTERLAQANAVKTFGDLPLIVRTAELNQQAGWQTMQSEMLALSSQSQHLIAGTAVTTSKWKSQMPSLQRS